MKESIKQASRLSNLKHTVSMLGNGCFVILLPVVTLRAVVEGDKVLIPCRNTNTSSSRFQSATLRKFATLINEHCIMVFT